MKTERTRQLPAFHTHVIGSLPRPQLVLDLLARRGELGEDRYHKVMDDMVVFAIRLQEEAGLDVITDGEWRRTHYIDEVLRRVGGFEQKWEFEHQGAIHYGDVVVKRMEYGEPLLVRDAEFLVANTDRVTKFSFPSPFLIGIRKWHKDYSADAYPTREHFIEHMAEIMAAEARAVVDAGVDIVQIDDPALTYFCDRELMAGEGSHDERLRLDWDIDRQMPSAVAAINRIADGLQAEIHLHCCHSVCKRQSDVVGDYKPILPRLSNAKIDRVNLEFAYMGTGDVSDLTELPETFGVGMGVIDVRTEKPQSIADIEAIGAAGAEVIEPSRIALNPDCGFAPDAGEPPTIDEAFEKLKRLCEASRRLQARFATDC